MTEATQRDLAAYLALLDRAPDVFGRAWDAIAIYDIDGRLVAGNSAARAIVGDGYASDLRGQHFSVHMGLDEATKAARVFAHVVTSGGSFDGETLIREANGTPIPVRTRVVPARIDGKIVGAIGFARDVREQRNVESRFIRAEEQFRAIFDNHPDALTILDLQGRFIRVNAGATRLTGYSVDEMIGKTPALLTPYDTWKDAERTMDGILRGEVIERSTVITTKSGARLHVELRGVPIVLGGVVRAFYLIGRDITEEHRRDRESARQTQRISELYDIASSSTSAQEKIENALAAGMRELGADWAYVCRLHDGMITLTHTSGMAQKAFPAGVTIPLETAIIRHAIEANDLLVIEDLTQPQWRRDIAGARSAWRSFVGMPLTTSGAVTGAVGFTTSHARVHLSPTDREYIRAIAALTCSAVAQMQREQRLDTLAFHDSLTGLPNRALLHDRLEQTLLAARRHRRSFAVHYIDIDRFKTINDTCGHHTGDYVLIAVAQYMRAMLRDSDTIARIGGDEFVVVQPEISEPGQAHELAARLVAINQRTFPIGARDFHVTVSVGSAVFPADAVDPVDLLHMADAALYAVKNRGRNGYELVTVG